MVCTSVRVGAGVRPCVRACVRGWVCMCVGVADHHELGRDHATRGVQIEGASERVTVVGMGSPLQFANGVRHACIFVPKFDHPFPVLCHIESRAHQIADAPIFSFELVTHNASADCQLGRGEGGI